jgi:hypothetical protein
LEKEHSKLKKQLEKVRVEMSQTTNPLIMGKKQQLQTSIFGY